MTDAQPTEGPGAEIVHLDPQNQTHAVVAQTMASLGMPTPAEWAALSGMAEQLSRSNLVPRNLQGRPDDVMLILLTGRDLSIAPTQALNKVHVIEGKPTISPELMTALVRRAGYPIWPASDNDRTKATALAEREGRRYEFTFTLEDAVVAGLCQIKDGKAFARSERGKALPWETYTQFMLWARAVSGLCRIVFADVLMGVSYVPEELGAQVDPTTGEPIEATASDYRPVGSPPPPPTVDQLAQQDGWRDVADWQAHKDRILAVITPLPDEAKAALKEWQAANGIPWPPSRAQFDPLLTEATRLANPGATVTGDPTGSGPTAEPVVTPHHSEVPKPDPERAAKAREALEAAEKASKGEAAPETPTTAEEGVQGPPAAEQEQWPDGQEPF